MEDRRRAPRFQFAHTTIGRVFTPDSHVSQAAWVRDISAGGASLLLGRSPESHGLLVVELSAPEQPRELPARLVHSTAQYDGTWLVGCEFVFGLEKDDLQALLS